MRRSAQTSITVRSPPTFTSSNSLGLGLQTLTRAAVWQIASAVSAAPAIARLSRTSPSTSMPGKPLARAWRDNTIGSWP